MKTVSVAASRQYDILIGSGLLTGIGQLVTNIGNASRICIVSDTNVWPIYGETVTSRLTDAGFECCSFVFPAGEAHKNTSTYLELLNCLAAHGLSRSDLIIALGGGVVGDLAGFAAATYLRGIRYIQIPTTLLAAVDSSVGGKTAIDLPSGKNLAGCFWQPCLVICDTDCLNTLPEDIFRDGCAEVIKYAILFDSELFAHLQQYGLQFDREWVIGRCIEWKRDVVSRDEFDTGERMLLNFGHTLGHAVESVSNYQISHGKAVAIGMAMICRTAEHLGICCSETSDQILAILNQFGLPCSVAYTIDELLAAACSDKKRSGGLINLIVPQAIGNCLIRPTPIFEFRSFIEAGF